VRTDVAVVADLDLIVELDAILDHRVIGGAAVDRGIGTDLYIVADEHAADLRNLVPASVLPREPEAIGTDLQHLECRSTRSPTIQS
jgi:hypothetical protein